MEPFVVGLGGTLRENSSTEAALRIALDAAESAGARTQLFGGATLGNLPLYDPSRAKVDEAHRLLEALRLADAVIIASPGYHGSISGLVKNALDYIEDLRADARPYLSGRAVGCISAAFGWQAAVTTLQTLRGIAHALRGSPTPLGAAVNSATTQVVYGQKLDHSVEFQLATVGRHAYEFGRAFSTMPGDSLQAPAN